MQELLIFLVSNYKFFKCVIVFLRRCYITCLKTTLKWELPTWQRWRSSKALPPFRSWRWVEQQSALFGDSSPASSLDSQITFGWSSPSLFSLWPTCPSSARRRSTCLEFWRKFLYHADIFFCLWKSVKHFLASKMLIYLGHRQRIKNHEWIFRAKMYFKNFLKTFLSKHK